MKKSFLRLIALNLILLMAISFPFCAFAEVDALHLGENILAPDKEAIDNEQPNKEYSFVPDETALYCFTPHEIGFSGIYYGEELVPEVASVTSARKYILEKDKEYTVVISYWVAGWVSGNLLIEKTPILKADGSVNPAGEYVFIPEETRYYNFSGYYFSVTEGSLNVGEKNYSLYNADQIYEITLYEPASVDKLEMPIVLSDNYYFLEEGNYSFYAPFSMECRISCHYGNLNIHDGDAQIYGDGQGSVMLEAEKTYRFEVLETASFDVYCYRHETELGEWAAGSHKFTPQQSGYYRFLGGEVDVSGAYFRSWDLFYLSAGEEYLITAKRPVTVSYLGEQYEEPEFTPLTLDGEIIPAGYYEFTPQETGEYRVGTNLYSDDYIGDDRRDGEDYLYRFYAGNTYRFFLNGDSTIEKVEFSGALETGNNTVIADPDETVTLTYEASETAWMYLQVSSNATATVYTDGEPAANLNPSVYLQMQEGQTYTIEYRYTGDPMEITPRIEINRVWNINSDYEGSYYYGNYLFTPEESGWYAAQPDWDGKMEMIDLSTGEDISLAGYCGELEVGKTYGLYLYGQLTYLGAENPFVSLELDGEEKAPGLYTFTIEDEGYYLCSAALDAELKGRQVINGIECAIYRLAAGTYYVRAEETLILKPFDLSKLVVGTTWFDDSYTEEELSSFYFVPEANGIYAFHYPASPGDLTTFEVSKGDESLGRGTDLILSLEGDARYDVAVDMDFSYSSWSRYLMISHVPLLEAIGQGIERGHYAFVPQQSGYYTLNCERWSGIKTADCQYLESDYGAYYLEAGTLYVIDANEADTFDLTYDGNELAYADLQMGENAAGRYSINVEQNGVYYFDRPVEELDDTRWSYDDELDLYRYPAAQGERHRFFSGEAFEVSFVPESESLQNGRNYIFSENTAYSFTPEADNWYRIAGQADGIRIYDGDTLLKVFHYDAYLRLEAGKTYTIMAKHFHMGGYATLDLNILSELELGEEPPYGSDGCYYFCPEESGYYIIRTCDGWVTELETGINISHEFEAYYLTAGKHYGFRLWSWEPIEKVEREYQPMVLDTLLQPGYYEFTPQTTGLYEIDTTWVNWYGDYFANETDENGYLFGLYKDSKIRFDIGEEFTMRLRPKTSIMQEGQNFVFSEGSSATLTFTPEQDGWYAFLVDYDSALSIQKKGEAPKQLPVKGDIGGYAELMGGQTYTIVYSSPSLAEGGYADMSIYRCKSFPALEAGFYQFTVGLTGYYDLEGEDVYNATDEMWMSREVGAYYLEEGKEYLAHIYWWENFTMEYLESSRTYREFDFDNENPAGYYKIASDKKMFFATTQPLLFGGGYGGADGEFDSYVVEAGETRYFYADEPFRAWDLGDFLWGKDPEEDWAYIYDYCGEAANIVIPAAIEGNPVKEVYPFWEGSEKPVSVVLSEGIKVIYCDGGPLDQKNLVNLVLPDSLENFGIDLWRANDLVMTIPVGFSFEGAFFEGNDYEEASSVLHVFFKGNAQQWEAVKATDETGTLAEAEVHLNSSAEDYTVEITKDKKVNIYCKHCKEYIRGEVHQHTYSNACDASCNTCGATRSVPGHSYTNACDTDCNVCGTPRSIKHTYTNACDASCNTCGATRSVPGHSYTNACDTDCNVCGNKRSIKHTYTNACDTSCNVCGANRSTSHSFGGYVYNNDATSKADGTKTRTCSVCNHKETVTAAGTKIANPFVDVVKEQYYTEPVLWAVGKKITTGTAANTFSPEEACTRGQIVTFLWRAAGKPEPKSSSNPFWDVSADQYYYKAVLWAVENGITTGATATSFEPEAACTRGQIVTFLHRAKGKPAAGSSNPFYDISGSAYYYSPVLWAVQNGITTGTSATTFEPEASCTRAQIVTFLYRAYK